MCSTIYNAQLKTQNSNCMTLRKDIECFQLAFTHDVYQWRSPVP